MLVYRPSLIRGIFHKCNYCKKNRSDWKLLYRSWYDKDYEWICGDCVMSLTKRQSITPALEGLTVLHSKPTYELLGKTIEIFCCLHGVWDMECLQKICKKLS